MSARRSQDAILGELKIKPLAFSMAATSVRRPAKNECPDARNSEIMRSGAN